MRGLNECAWLRIGTIETCPNRCIGQYCHIHNQQLKKGRKSPIPCRRCGVGTGSITLLCKSCGSHRIAQKLIDTEKRARKQYVHILSAIKARETPKNLTLLYFGAGWDFSPLSNPDYHQYTDFIFIDPLPDTPHYRDGQVGYPLSKDRISFVDTLAREAEKEGLELLSDIEDLLTFTKARGTILKYHINMTVEQALSSPSLRPKISAAKWIHEEVFSPFEYGLKATHLPKTYLTLSKLREAMPSRPT